MHDISFIHNVESHLTNFVVNFPGFAYTFHLSPDGHGSFPFVSPGIEKLYGLKPEDVQDDMAPLHAMAHPEDAPHIIASLDQSSRTMKPVHVDFRICCPGLPVRWAEFRSVPVRQDDGSTLWHGMMQDITERKQMQEALAAREQEFRSLAENLPDNIARWDIEGRCLYSNPTHQRTLGKTLEEMLGKTNTEIFGDDRFAFFDEIMAQVISTGQETQVLRVPVPMPDGGTDYHDIRLAPEFDGEGRVISVLGIARNMTDAYRMQETIARREQEFRSLAESSPNTIIRYDREGRIRYLNSELALILGVSAAEVIDKLPSEAWPDGRYDVIQQAAAQALETETEVSIELCAQSAGEPDFYQVQVVPERDVAGQMIGTIAFGVDISAIRNAERRLTNVVANFPGFAYTFRMSPEGHCSFPFASPGIEKLYGLKPEDVRDDMAPLHALTHPEDRPRIEAAIAESARTMSLFNVEYRLCRPDQPQRWIECRSVPMCESDGSIIWHGLMIDITERKQIDTERQRLLDILEQSADYIGYANLDGTLGYHNPAARRMLGLAEDADISSMRIADIHPAWANKLTEETALSSLQEKSIWRGESAVLHRDGHEIPVLQMLMLHRDAEGRPLFTSTIMTDITELRRQQLLEVQRQRVFEIMAQGGTLTQILVQVAIYIETYRPGLRSSIMLIEDDGNRLCSVVTPSFPQAAAAAINGVDIADSSGCCAAAARSGERVIVEDMRHHPCWTTCQEFCTNNSVRASWTQPIIASSGQVLGVVVAYLQEPGTPESADLELLRQASRLCSIAIERKQLESQMLHQASYDSLTGLPNRRLFGDRLQEEVAKAERNGGNVAILFIDLDYFKEVNDTLGHHYGDQLLIKVPQRIQQCVRKSDTVARLGGDEFVVILPKVTEITNLGRVAQSIIEAMTSPFHLEEHVAYTSASIGIASYPADAGSITALMSAADQAMYAAKSNGRNCFSFFTPAMQQQAQQRLSLGNELRDAISKEQLHIFLQPIVDITSGHIVKAEALIRWKHPQHGMVPPDKFIPIAEEMGLIHEIGDWVFHQAVQAIQRWLEISTTDNGDCQISINVSARQFTHADLGMAWISHLSALGIPMRHIVIEITESLLLGDETDVRNKLQRFRDAGMNIALDDFGTGYSSMSYLKKFNIDFLKIDRSFVRDLETDPNDRAIAEAIVVMAHKLGLKTIAEGVETERQKVMLAEVGCDYVQGYFYAKPMPVEEFMAFVNVMGTTQPRA